MLTLSGLPSRFCLAKTFLTPTVAQSQATGSYRIAKGEANRAGSEPFEEPRLRLPGGARISS